MAQASLKIDQVGLSAGVAGRSRADGLATGALVTLTSADPGSPTVFEFLWVPNDDVDAVASLVTTGNTATFTPTASISGTYRIRLTIGAGRTKSSQIRTFSIRTANLALRKPALGERASEKASLLYSGADAVARSETNEPEFGTPFASGNYGGWYESMMELYDAVDTLGGGAPAPTGVTNIDVSLTTTNTNPTLIYTYTPIADDTLISFQVQVMAAMQVKTALFVMAVLCKIDTGVTTELDTYFVNGPFRDDPAWDVTINATGAGGTVEFIVTGNFDDTNWRITGTATERAIGAGGGA